MLYNVYQKIFDIDPQCDKFLLRFTLGEIKDMLKRALEDGRIDPKKVSKKIGEELDKLSNVG